MLLAGGGLNAAISSFTGTSPFNAIEEFKGEYRCITADLRNATTGQSTGPVEVDRPRILRRRPTRPDGSSGHRQVHGDGVLHRRPVHLESREARAQSCGRGGAGAARGMAAGDARPEVPTRILEDLGSGTDCPAARAHDLDGR